MLDPLGWKLGDISCSQEGGMVLLMWKGAKRDSLHWSEVTSYTPQPLVNHHLDAETVHKPAHRLGNQLNRTFELVFSGALFSWSLA